MFALDRVTQIIAINLRELDQINKERLLDPTTNSWGRYWTLKPITT